jgi:WhiB family redox-sensing transcriptional regulator
MKDMQSRTVTRLACESDPERWTTTDPDDLAIAACRRCPVRPQCAREAYEIPNSFGLWAGIIIPEMPEHKRWTKARNHAYRRLKSIAEGAGLQMSSHRPTFVNRYRGHDALADVLIEIATLAGPEKPGKRLVR